ncbi:MAG: peptide deformylase [Rhodocyclaceae bacterium]|jgi:peptide deformylase|nr:peptide deformylase [Rhodocyclaceae bacterium]MCE2980104.1 peptide deformylase [Betaproteobacteria bacterium]MCA3076429.1 peptide deformylase [Rhodocyclaceae bacterium]MCA3090402.1 peptide deformylase [Rhodocyclaceae bacterium]MCA3096078.1 peptide deformylase [Rhodocyclaceae bacterium]
MALLPILHFPDPRLQKVAAPIERIDDEVRRLAADMAETMYAAPGIGLAATQVDVHRRLIVIDISEAHDQLLTLINPRILGQSTDTQECEEGCLSVPGIFDEVERPAQVEIEALGLDGQSFRLKAEGLLAVCVQHEMDHLDGIVFVDHLSRLKRNRIVSKLRKQQHKVL